MGIWARGTAGENSISTDGAHDQEHAQDQKGHIHLSIQMRRADLGNRMLLTDPLGIDAFSEGPSDRHHSACRRVHDDQDSRLLLGVTHME